MKIWYKKKGDTKPTMTTHGDEVRPGESFFVAEPIQSRFAPLLRIVWKDGVPSAKYPTTAQIDALKQEYEAKQAVERNKPHRWERAILALRHETKGTATQADLKILNNLQKKENKIGVTKNVRL